MPQIDKTAFSPAIAQLAMPDKESSPLYAIGGGLVDYDKQAKMDRMFDVDVKGKELDTEKNQFALDTAKQKAPIEIESAQVNLDNAKFDQSVIKPMQAQSTQLELDKKATEKESGVWDAENQTKKDQATVAHSNAQYADENNKLRIDTEKANLANTGLTTQINTLKLSAAKSDDHITQASYYFYDDTNGDGIVNEKDFTMIKDKLKGQGVDEKFIDGAYMMARQNIAKVEETESKSTKNIALSVKNENVGKVKDKMADQFSGMEQLKNLMTEGYSPDKAGIVGGTAQVVQEKLPIISGSDASYYASQREAIKGALAKAVGGSAPSNYEQQMAEKIVGGAWNSTDGASAKYKSALDRGIIGMGETINRLDASGMDTSAYKVRLKDYVNFRASIDKWDGSTTISDYLAKQKPKTNESGTRSTKFSASKENNVTPPPPQGLPNPMNY